MASLEEKKENRFKMLKMIYDITGGDRYKFVNMWEIGEQLHFDRATTEQITQYLVGEGLIESRGIGGIIGISHYGVKQVEEAMENPDRATRYFPPVNIITIGTMLNSQIQQGSTQATQIQSINVESSARVKEFIDKLKVELETLPIDDPKKEEIRADIMTVEGQLKKGTPNKTILSESLKSIRTILEGISSNVVAQGLIALIQNVR